MRAQHGVALVLASRKNQRAVACGDATLPQQEKNTRQMSRREEYGAMYLPSDAAASGEEHSADEQKSRVRGDVPSKNWRLGRSFAAQRYV